MDDFSESYWTQSYSDDDYSDSDLISLKLGLKSEEYQKVLDDSDREIDQLISDRQSYDSNQETMRLVNELWTESGNQWQQEIIKRLINSEFVRRCTTELNDCYPFNGCLQPFSAISYFDPVNSILQVPGGQLVYLKNGIEVELVKWLLDQGITDGKCIFGHVVSVTYSEAGMSIYLFTYDKEIAENSSDDNLSSDDQVDSPFDDEVSPFIGA